MLNWSDTSTYTTLEPDVRPNSYNSTWSSRSHNMETIRLSPKVIDNVCSIHHPPYFFNDVPFGIPGLAGTRRSSSPSDHPHLGGEVQSCRFLKLFSHIVSKSTNTLRVHHYQTLPCPCNHTCEALDNRARQLAP